MSEDPAFLLDGSEVAHRSEVLSNSTIGAWCKPDLTPYMAATIRGFPPFSTSRGGAASQQTAA